MTADRDPDNPEDQEDQGADATAFARSAQDRASEMQRGADATKERLVGIRAENRAARQRLDSHVEQGRTETPEAPPSRHEGPG